MTSRSPTSSPLLVVGALLVSAGINLVRLSVAAGVLNAILLPIVLGFLYRVARCDVPEELRLRGCYAIAVALVFVVTGGLGVYAGVVGIF